MALPRLRVYNGPNENAGSSLAYTLPMRQTVDVTLGEVLPILADALQNRRMWLEDFETDEITISADLHEVLLAYQNFRRPSA